jgi:hypothetical protein
MQIDVWPDYVVIEGQRVNRPRRISVKQWLDEWDLMCKKLTLLSQYG